MRALEDAYGTGRKDPLLNTIPSGLIDYGPCRIEVRCGMLFLLRDESSLALALQGCPGGCRSPFSPLKIMLLPGDNIFPSLPLPSRLPSAYSAVVFCFD